MYKNSYRLLTPNVVLIYIAKENWESQYLKVIDRNIVDDSCAGWELRVGVRTSESGVE
jgi:hypothetical protein